MSLNAPQRLAQFDAAEATRRSEFERELIAIDAKYGIDDDEENQRLLDEFDGDTVADRLELEDEIEEEDDELEDEIEEEDDDDDFDDDEVDDEVDGPASFAAPSLADIFQGQPGGPDLTRTVADLARRKGVIFRAGTYPEKGGFSMSPSELRKVVAEYPKYGPVKIKLEHRSTILDEQLGELAEVEMGADGSSLVGTVYLPLWLDSLISKGKRAVSAAFNPQTKRLLELSLVNTPYIPDAALFSAYEEAQSAPAPASAPSLSRQARLERDLSLTDQGRAALRDMQLSATFSSVAEAPPMAQVYQAMPSDLAIRAMIADARPVFAMDQEEVALLEAGRRVDGPALLAAIEKQIHDLETYPSGDSGLHLAKLRRMREALASAKADKPVRYTGPTPAEVLDATGLVRLNGAFSGGSTLAEVLSAVNYRRPSAGPATEAEALARAAKEFVSGGGSAAAYKAARRDLERHADETALAAAIAGLDGALRPALAELTSVAIESAGGRDAVVRDYAELLSLDKTPTDPNLRRLHQLEERLESRDPGLNRQELLRQKEQIVEAIEKRGEVVPKPGDLPPDESERAQVEQELRMAGATPTSPDPGRTVARLQGRHAALTEAIAVRLKSAHERTTATATKAVEDALSGDIRAVESLSAAVGKSPKSFAKGLAAALAKVPLEAARRCPTGAFSLINV